MQCLGASKILRGTQVFSVFPRGGKTYLDILGEYHHKNFAFKIKCSFAHLKGVWQPQDSLKRLLTQSSPQHPCYAKSTAARADISPREWGGLHGLKSLKTKQQVRD